MTNAATQHHAAPAPDSQVATSGTPVGAANGETPVEEYDTSGAIPDDLDIGIDELVGADFGNDPAMQGQHKGINYADVLKHIPENGRKVIQNLRSSYTQKTQEIAELRRQVETERQELERQRDLFTKSEWVKQVEQMAQQQPQHDAWSDEGLQERINQKAAEMMKHMLTPLQHDLEVQKRQVQLDQFKSKHPDISSPELRVPVAKLLVERPELKLEDAYYIVKAQTQTQQAQQAKQVQKQVLSKTSTGNAVRNSAPPKFRDAWSAYQWHKSQVK
jgi:hypothetical protein